MPIEAIPDHVAIAVPSIDRAAQRWHDQLGGGWIGTTMGMEDGDFATRQLRYPGDARLELLEPRGERSFAAAFIQRFGPRVHHVTLKVAELLPAVRQLEREGYDVVDVSMAEESWHEGFLRPSQVGGMIVQIAWAPGPTEEYAVELGAPVEDPAEDAAVLHGPTLAHPDLPTSRAVWTALGAEVVDREGGLDVAWPGSQLTVRVVPGPSPTSLGLRVSGHRPLEADPELGPATLTE